MFATLVSEAGIDRPELCRELQVDPLVLEQWLSGSAPPPDHVMRSIMLIAEYATGNRLGARSVDQIQPKETKGLKLVSLFSGAGGLDIGLENAGFRTLLANEIQGHACESLRANKMLSTMNRAEFGCWFDRQVTN